MTLPILASCNTTNERLTAAAEKKGTALARVTLPPWPEDCRVKEPHATLTVGDEVRSVLKRERLATDRANDRVERCAGHYDELAKTIQ